MPQVVQVIHTREERRAVARKNPLGRAGLGCSLLISLFLASSALAIALIYTNLKQDLPSPDVLPALLEPPDGLLLRPTRLYDRTGQHVLLTLQNPAVTERRYTPLAPPLPPPINGGGSGGDYISPNLITATIAVRDPGFFQHAGYSYLGILEGSHPTLAQQLVFDLLLDREPPGLRRALRERLLAAEVTARFGRRKVLEWYLNTADFGRWAIGADAAARAYFGKPPSRLSLAEAAVLAGVTQSPGLNPHDAPRQALEGRGRVLQALLEQRLVEPKLVTQAIQETVVFQPPVERSPGDSTENLAPTFTSLVLDQLETEISRQELERGGLQVITTLDVDLQNQAACTTAIQMSRLKSSQAIPSESDFLSTSTGCPAAQYLPAIPSTLVPPTITLQANTVVIDPAAGQVLAMVGERAPGQNPARLPGHPPGTLLTPFIYLTAFTHGFSPGSLVWDIPSSPSTGSGQGTRETITNYDSQYHGPVRLRVALANDYLLPAAHLLNQLGPENTWLTARRLGITSLTADHADYTDYAENKEVERLILDGGEVTLLEVSQAFAILANQGILPGQVTAGDQSGTVLRVEDLAGRNRLATSSSGAQPVITPQLAFLLNHALSDESARWPAWGRPNSLEIGRPAAAKIGRTASGLSSWAIGYTPQRLVGVWVGQWQAQTGQANSKHIDPNGGAQVAAAIWHAILRYASRDLPAEAWIPPADISTVAVCDPSGMLPTAVCPSVVNEVFQAGSEPVQADTLYKIVHINRETNRLATVYTPPEVIEERVYLNVPQEAQAWANQAGIPQPPEDYDLVGAQAGRAGEDHPSTAHSAEVNITSPAMFTAVRGRVDIQGSAGGKDFSSYRIQIGQGLNPAEWVQVGQDITQPVADGRLTFWDTSGLDGLYAIQLRVVQKNQKINTAIVQVTVDNQPPAVRILYPAADQEFSSAQRRTITLQVEATDNLAIREVTFSIDGKQVETLQRPPFALPWSVTSGSHTLSVQVTDLAGNKSQATSAFKVK